MEKRNSVDQNQLLHYYFQFKNNNKTSRLLLVYFFGGGCFGFCWSVFRLLVFVLVVVFVFCFLVVVVLLVCFFVLCTNNIIFPRTRNCFPIPSETPPLLYV